MFKISNKTILCISAALLLLGSAASAYYYELAFIGDDSVDPTNWTVGYNWKPYEDIPFEGDPCDWQSPQDCDLVWIGNNCVIPSGYVAYVRDFTLTVNYPGNPDIGTPAGPANQDVSMTIESGGFLRSDFNFYTSYFGPTDYKTILNIERGAIVIVGWAFSARSSGASEVNLDGYLRAEGKMGTSFDLNAYTHIDFGWSGMMALGGDYTLQFSDASSWVQEGLITDRGVAYGQPGWGTTHGLKVEYKNNSTIITSIAYTPDPNAATNPNPADKYDNVYPDQILSWNAPVIGPANMSYKLYFGMNPDLNVTPVELTSTSYTPPVLLKGNTYYWRVDIVDASTGQTVKTGFKWEFTLPITAKPELLSPASGSDVIQNTLSLQWKTDSYATENTLSLRLASDETWTDTVVTESNYQPTGLEPGEAYEWKVKSVFPDSSVLESDIWTFNTVDPVCNGGQRLIGDENDDCIVNISDLAIKLDNWLRW